MGMETAFFSKALPVWPEGREREMNLTCAFKTVFSAGENDDFVLRLAASTLYRAWLNGEFFAYGPARAPHGMFRVDELPLPARLKGRNVLVVEVAGYNTNGYYMLDQPSFLQAELLCGGKPAAYTGGADFTARILSERVRRVQKYSFQRTFTEYYRLDGAYERWLADEAPGTPLSAADISAAVRLLPRTVPLPRYTAWPAAGTVKAGSVTYGHVPEHPFNDRAVLGEELYIKTFKKSELECCLSDEGQQMAFSGKPTPLTDAEELRLEADRFAIVDFKKNVSGFLSCALTCESPATVYFFFDEVLKDGDVDFLRSGCCSAVRLDLQQGTHRFETFESYTMRYLKIVACKAPVSASGVFIRRYQSGAELLGPPDMEDGELSLIYDAAAATFLDNAVDTLTDCPSRERAAWLCDTFFMARAECALTGGNRIERAFLENYLLPRRFDHIPDGMLPMNYPADDHEMVYIPNWALWLVAELHDYLARTGDRGLVDAFKPKIDRLFAWFLPFENEFGLLEGLTGWVFIEWSKANELTQDVSFPTNMLYSHALSLAGELYGDPALKEKAAAVAGAVDRLSFDGEFYHDNALRENGELRRFGERTEVCQYYAFFCGVASPETRGELWDTLVNDFGPRRRRENKHPDIHFANAFIGNYLRLELFSRRRMTEKLLDEIKGYFLGMAERTGTLWEFDSICASCCHGFTSVIAWWLKRVFSDKLTKDKVESE